MPIAIPKWLTFWRNTKPLTIYTIEEYELLQYICKRYNFILKAKCVSSPIDFTTYKGREYKARTAINKGTWVIIIEVLDNISSLTIKTNTEEDCVVCSNTVNETIKCCGQRVCQDCLVKIKEISKTNENGFNCPMCRKELDNYYTTHTFSEEFIDKNVVICN